MSVAEIADKRGAELAWHVFDFIEQNPEHHNQNCWIAPSPEHLAQLDEDEWFPITADAVLEHCGTTACFAGWTSLLIGRRLDACGFTDEGPSGTGARITATRALGLVEEQASRLFFDAQTLDDVRKELERIYGPRPGQK